jgi:hypothetical protein
MESLSRNYSDLQPGLPKWVKGGEASTPKLAVLIPWSSPRIVRVTADSEHLDVQDLEAQVCPDIWIMEIQTYLKDNILLDDSASTD